MEQVRIVVDVMGGDEEPRVVLDGIAAALEADAGLVVLACGPEEVVAPFCAEQIRAEALVAPQVIEMGDDPIQAVMRKRKSSIVVGCRAVKRGQADGFFSAGSTGAITAAGTAYVTPFKYVDAAGSKHPVRPCLANPVPNRAGGETVLADMGANPDVDPEDMVHFAQMASAYARVVCGIENPRVGLLSNGTEEHKGSVFTQACYPLMAEQVPGFAGNCEGSSITDGSFDVVVADGFAGNVALKSIEGAAKLLMSELKSAIYGSTKGKVAGLLLKSEMGALKAKLSGDSHGGAILLGLRGVVLIGHGATSVEAVKNGAIAAAEAVRGRLVENVASSVPNIA